MKKKTIHDIGAGVCDMNDFLIEKKINCEYSGTEIVQEMIDATKEKKPEIKLYNRNILTDTIEDTYNYVVLTGVFNIPGKVDEKDWKIFAFSIIEKMFSMCTEAISFNFLTTYKTRTDSTLFYLTPEEVLGYCLKNLSRFVTIDHSYALYEYTVTVNKKEYLKTTYNQQLFSKYFA